jgi:hypothetical protein
LTQASFGGFKMNLAGANVDLVVSILDQAYIHHGPICRCLYGATARALAFDVWQAAFG